MFQLGGLLSPTLGVLGFMKQDEKLLWTARNFGNFSIVCTVLACTGNPRNFGSWKEKSFIVTSFTTYCSGQFSYGSELSRLDDKAAVKTGKMGMMMVAFTMLVSLPALLHGVKLFSRFSDAKLSSSMLSMFQSVPSLLGSLLYVASTSFRCILQSDEKLGSVVEQCGNPIQPANVVSLYLFLAWLMGYFIGPMASDASKLSWKQVMELRMTKLQFTNGGLFSALSLLASIIFANTNESGAAYDDFLQLLVSLFMLVFVVFFDYDFF